MEEERDSLQKFLPGRDIDCPRCGYNLRDLHGFFCPECGEFITIDSLQPDAALTNAQEFARVAHGLNYIVIWIIGICTGLMFISRFLGPGKWGFSPEIVFLFCLLALATERFKVPELIHKSGLWFLLFNPVVYIALFGALAFGTSYLGFM